MSNVGGINGVSGGNIPDFGTKKSDASDPIDPTKKEEAVQPTESTLDPTDVLEISPEGQEASDAIQAVLVDPNSTAYRLNPAAAQQVIDEEEKKRKKREEQ